AHLVVTAARRHARLEGDSIERFQDAVDGSELRDEGGAVEMFELLPPIVGERPPGVSFDLRADGGIREADESLDTLALAQLPAQLAEYLDVDSHREPLGVDEHAIAVEDDHLDHVLARLNVTRGQRAHGPSL